MSAPSFPAQRQILFMCGANQDAQSNKAFKHQLLALLGPKKWRKGN